MSPISSHHPSTNEDTRPISEVDNFSEFDAQTLHDVTSVDSAPEDLAGKAQAAEMPILFTGEGTHHLTPSIAPATITLHLECPNPGTASLSQYAQISGYESFKDARTTGYNAGWWNGLFMGAFAGILIAASIHGEESVSDKKGRARRVEGREGVEEVGYEKRHA